MIKGYCTTNLDDYQKEDWPKTFVAIPHEGDWVEAKSGKVLKVCKVSHKQNFEVESLLLLDVGPGHPYIKVELHKTVTG